MKKPELDFWDARIATGIGPAAERRFGEIEFRHLVLTNRVLSATLVCINGCFCG